LRHLFSGYHPNKQDEQTRIQKDCDGFFDGSAEQDLLVELVVAFHDSIYGKPICRRGVGFQQSDDFGRSHHHPMFFTGRFEERILGIVNVGVVIGPIFEIQVHRQTRYAEDPF